MMCTELINAPEVPDQCPTIPEQDQVFLCRTQTTQAC